MDFGFSQMLPPVETGYAEATRVLQVGSRLETD